MQRTHAAQLRMLARFPGFAVDPMAERDTQMVQFLRAAITTGRAVPAPFQAVLWCTAAAHVRPPGGALPTSASYRLLPYVQLLTTLAAAARERPGGQDVDDALLVACAALQLVARLLYVAEPAPRATDIGKGLKRQRLESMSTSEVPRDVAMLASALGDVADAYLAAHLGGLAARPGAPFAGSPTLAATVATAENGSARSAEAPATHVAQALALAAHTRRFLLARRVGPPVAGADLCRRAREAHPALALVLEACLGGSSSDPALVLRGLACANEVAARSCPYRGPLANVLRREVLAVLGPEPCKSAATCPAAALAVTVGGALLVQAAAEQLVNRSCDAALVASLQMLADGQRSITGPPAP